MGAVGEGPTGAEGPTATRGGRGGGVLRMKGPRVGEAGEELRLLRAEEKGWCDVLGTGPQTAAAGRDAAPDAA